MRSKIDHPSQISTEYKTVIHIFPVFSSAFLGYVVVQFQIDGIAAQIFAFDQTFDSFLDGHWTRQESMFQLIGNLKNWQNQLSGSMHSRWACDPGRSVVQCQILQLFFVRVLPLPAAHVAYVRGHASKPSPKLH